ncbi:unnamed protein product [Rotaria magnacalcarata]|nr:unnamed protein product [Rotaria magnacalcarata]CAF4182515.1 unnamed protein product [Rotaria magnacalcarata]
MKPISLVKGQHQEYMFVKYDASRNHAIVFIDDAILALDLDSLKMSIGKDIMHWRFRTHAVDLTGAYVILVGSYKESAGEHISRYVAIFLDLATLRAVNMTLLCSVYQFTSRTFTYHSDNGVSIAINSERNMAIIGLSAENIIIFLSINVTIPWSENSPIHVIRTEVSSQYHTGFGQSVAWIDNTLVAVNILNVGNPIWSQSEVWVFDIDKSFQRPLFIFPNNQQKLYVRPPPRFLQILSWSKNLFILEDNRQALLIPSQPAGYFSSLNTNKTLQVLAFESVPCIAGTYKNTSDFGPCTVCPPQTKNVGNQPCSQCESCAPTSFCPSAAVGDVSLHTYPSYIQAFSYPNKPYMNNYDDLLVHNIFTIGYSRRCIIMSALFWTTIAVTLSIVIWLFMVLLKMSSSSRAQNHRNKAKRLLKKADIVNQGERWVGGLFTLAILLIFGFTFRFASGFLKLYPIETSDISQISCDDTMRNALFDSLLQMPLPYPDGSQWRIFDMLDNQSFIMTLDLLSTAADCSSITVQQNRHGVNYLNMPITSCVLQPDNSTRSVSFLLPTHQINLQINISGPFFVGGMRLCLYGIGYMNGVSRLRTLDMCKTFWTENETLSRFTTLHMVLIKMINLTKPLEVGGEIYYDGRWSPTFAETSLSDKLIYEQDGYHLRYIAERTILSITMNEQPFYLQNTQEPIVRKAELAFHTLLFCTLIIELFGMSFLFFRLIAAPLFRLILSCCHHNKRSENIEQLPKMNESNSESYRL